MRPFARRASILLIPASLNLGVVYVVAPVLNGLLARGRTPDAAIGGYAIAMSVMALIALPQLRVQQLTLVFLDDRASARRLWRLVLGFAALSTAAAAAAAFTPARGLILDGVFGTRGALRGEAEAALLALAPFPGLAIVRTHLYGAALRIGRSGLVWAGTITGAAAVIAAAFLIQGLDPDAGARLAALAVSIGAAVETVVLAAGASKALRRDLAAAARPPPAYGAMLRFFAPLLVAAFLPTVTQPVVNAALTRAPEPEASVAAVALVFGASQVFMFALVGLQPTLLALLARGENPALTRRFANGVGLLSLAPLALVAFVPLLTSFVAHTVLGASGRLQDMTELGFRLLAPLPPILVQETICTSALLRVRRPRPLVIVNAIRLVGLLAILLIGVTATDLPGGPIGVAAIGGALVIEAAATVAFGLGAQRRLERDWELPPRALTRAPAGL